MGEDAKTEDPNPQEQRPEMAPAAGEDKDTAAAAIILKLNLHCDCCAKKLKRSISKNFEGVEEVITDLENCKLTVKGRVDPANLLKKLEEKTGRKIQLLSPLSIPSATAAAAGGNKKADGDSEKKPEQSETNKDDKKPKEIVVVLKIRLHCEGCMHKIKRVIKKYDGVKSIDFEATKNLVKVVGVMEVNALVSYLKYKLKRNVEVIPLKKDILAGGEISEKKEKDDIINDKSGEGEGVKRDTKEKEFGDEKTKNTKIVDQRSDDNKEIEHYNKSEGVLIDESREEKSVRIEEAKVETNKMEYYGQTHNSYYSMPPSMPIYNHVYINHGRYYGYGHDYDMSSDRSREYNSNQGFVNYPNSHQGYHNEGYNLQQYPQSPGPYAAFSDENPNASCYVM